MIMILIIIMIMIMIIIMIMIMIMIAKIIVKIIKIKMIIIIIRLSLTTVFIHSCDQCGFGLLLRTTYGKDVPSKSTATGYKTTENIKISQEKDSVTLAIRNSF